jgi:hypothetical protein
MLVQHTYVFPLERVNSHLNGYYMDHHGHIYSTKKGNLQRLSGTKQPSGHYYTLGGISYKSADLIRLARARNDFLKETDANAPNLLPQRPLPTAISTLGAAYNGRTKVASNAIAKKGYILATVGPTDRFVFGTDPVLHLEEGTAKEEAMRVATLKPGTEVVIFKVLASVVAGGVTWK